MAGKKKFVVKTPKGTIYTYASKNGKVTAELEWNPDFAPRKEKGFENTQQFVDSECIRRMAPDTPMLTGALKKSPILGTTIGSGRVHQNLPYARRQYYEHKEKSYWFERMKNRDKESILKGAQKYASN